jgi:P-type E1-E2 ATPase
MLFLVCGLYFITIKEASILFKTWDMIVYDVLMSIGMGIPPVLPFAIEVGVLNSIKRLKGRQIYCLNSFKIIDTGFVDTIVFDKTGTLTES